MGGWVVFALVMAIFCFHACSVWNNEPISLGQRWSYGAVACQAVGFLWLALALLFAYAR